MHAIFDTVIIGGGIAGASAAYFLSPRRSVLILEKESQSGYHSTGRSAAEFTERFHSPVSGKLTKASYDFMMQPPKGFSEVELLKRRGNLIIADRSKARRLERTFQNECEFFPGILRLTTKEAIEMAPILNPDYLSAAFFDPDCWDIEVESLLQGYLRGARNFGAILQTQSEVMALRREGDYWIVETMTGAVRAKTIVNAAGAWADGIAKLGNVEPLGLTPFRRTAITVDVPDWVDISVMPEVTEIEEVFYFKPEAGKLMASPADATESPPCDARPEELDIAYAMHYLEMATSLDVCSISHEWAGLRTFAPDQKPVVGYSRDVPDFFWLAGQGGYGIQTSPALGKAAASLLLHGSLTEELGRLGLTKEELSPSRFD